MVWEHQPVDAEMPQLEKVRRRDFLKMAGVALGGSALTLGAYHLSMQAPVRGAFLLNQRNLPQQTYDAAESIQTRTFPNLSAVEGISRKQLDQHLALYQGYVQQFNDLQTRIRKLSPAADNALYRELHIGQTYALNGVVFHEAYFENIGGAQTLVSQAGVFHNAVTREFGSWENYKKHLLALGKTMRGWVLTGYNLRDRRIHNYGLDLHHQWAPMGVVPLLVLDVYEHAYMLDFGSKRDAYLDAFLANVDWQVVESRMKAVASGFTLNLS
ncbi:MAG TPA: Fe-Mn family superoxide dismutase [Oculatellaceae cyanobacterium]|jgi:Fe-Mn family superoxide dismutase